MSLRPLLEAVGTTDYSIAVVGDDAPGPLADLLEDEVGTIADVETTDSSELQPAIEDVVDAETATSDLAVLLEDGRAVAASSMSSLYESLLAVNSDLFVTGARGLGEISLPDVLAGLEGSRLRLRGYPLAHKEKLLLILISRYIEQLAWEGGSGTLRSSFQQLSRIDDEVGTRQIYERLAATELDVHVYGTDDVEPQFPATVHTGSSRTYRDAWFVVYTPGDDAETTEAAALVCLETEPRIWNGFFTFDSGCVADVEERITEAM